MDQEAVDVSTTRGSEIYKGAIAPLPSTFDCEHQGLRVFLSDVFDQSLLYGWGPILNIPVDPSALQHNTSSLLTQYGTISHESLVAHADTYISVNSYNAQHAQWMYHCIMGSLTTMGKTKVILCSSKYMHAGRFSGPLLLKVIIQETSVNSNASFRQIRDNLTSLDSYMRFIKSDILAFNMHVRSLLDTLHSCGETTNDLLSNLFRGYKAASTPPSLSTSREKRNNLMIETASHQTSSCNMLETSMFH